VEGGRLALMRALVAVLVLSGLLVGCQRPRDAESGRRPQSLPVIAGAAVHGDYVTRQMTIPSGYRSAGRQFLIHERRNPRGSAEPLVLLLHGLFQTPIRVERATAASEFSDAHHFTLVYPIGVNEDWNAGTCCRSDTANDVGYLVDLVHYVSTQTPVDLHRVYLWGFSNGGMMAWRAVCQTSGVFAGAGVMAGALLVPCPRPVNVVDVHGLADHTVPYYGGYSRYTHTVIPDSADERAKLPAGSTLKLILVKGLGHQWPPYANGGLDALDVFWTVLGHYRVAHPATA
jgi:poly(3-hydroxybutyrate) depolymerase